MNFVETGGDDLSLSSMVSSLTLPTRSSMSLPASPHEGSSVRASGLHGHDFAWPRPAARSVWSEFL